MKSKKLPHITRKYPASLVDRLLSLGLTGFLIWLFIFNLGRQNRLNALPDQTTGLFYPFASSAQTHLELARTYALNDRTTDARRELALAAKYFSGNPGGSMVLGANTVQSYLNNWENENRKLESDRLYWKTVAGDRPDYRDAYLSWAMSAYRQGNLTEARTALTVAKKLDPNHPVVGLFWGLLF